MGNLMSAICPCTKKQTVEKDNMKLDLPFNPQVSCLQLSWEFPDDDNDVFLQNLPSFIKKLRKSPKLDKFLISNSEVRKFGIVGGRWVPSVDRWPDVSRVLDMMRLNLLNPPRDCKPLAFEIWFGQNFYDHVNNISITAVYIIRRRKLYLELFEPKLNLRIPTGRNLKSMNSQEIIHFTKTRIIQYYRARNGVIEEE